MATSHSDHLQQIKSHYDERKIIPILFAGRQEEQLRWNDFVSALKTDELVELLNYLNIPSLDVPGFQKITEIAYALTRIERKEDCDILIDKVLTILASSNGRIYVNELVRLVNWPWTQDQEGVKTLGKTRDRLISVIEMLDKREVSEIEKYGPKLWLIAIEDKLKDRDRAKEIFSQLDKAKIPNDLEKLYFSLYRQLGLEAQDLALDLVVTQKSELPVKTIQSLRQGLETLGRLLDNISEEKNQKNIEKFFEIMLNITPVFFKSSEEMFFDFGRILSGGEATLNAWALTVKLLGPKPTVLVLSVRGFSSTKILVCCKAGEWGTLGSTFRAAYKAHYVESDTLKKLGL